MRVVLYDRHWTIILDILSAVYQVSPLGSPLRRLCFLGFVSMEDKRRSLDWESAFIENLSLSQDYFQYQNDSDMYYSGIETGGTYRFHDYSNIDGWKTQDLIDCPYSL